MKLVMFGLFQLFQNVQLRIIFANFQVDIANYDEIVILKEKIKRDLGDVDILINNAGLLTKVSLMEGSPEDILRVFNVNLISHFWVNCVRFQIRKKN